MDNKGATSDTNEKYVNAEVHLQHHTYEKKYPGEKPSQQGAQVFPPQPPYKPEHHHQNPVRIDLDQQPPPYEPPTSGQMWSSHPPGMVSLQPPHSQGLQDGRQKVFQHSAGVRPTYPAQRVVSKPMVTDMQPLLDTPVNRWCSQCNREIVTLVDSNMTGAGWAWCILCCVIGGGLITALVSCCLNGFKEFKHHCPKCRSLIGVYNPKLTGCEILILILATCLPIVIGVLVIMYLR